jgi:hypothetical protein
MGYCGIGVLRCWSVEVSGYRGFLLNLRDPNGFLLRGAENGESSFFEWYERNSRRLPFIFSNRT